MEIQALRLTGDFDIDALSFDTVTLHDPEPHQILIRVHAASLNYRDLMVAAGIYNPHVVKPRILGSDCAGEVIAVGGSVTKFRVGDRVIGAFMPDWIDGKNTQAGAGSALGEAQDGVFATHALFPEHGLVPLPSSFSYEEGATFPCAATTAWHGLVTSGQLAADQTVLVQGTGGVSLFALQIAKMHGATVIATSSSDEKLERVKTMGADHTINYRKLPKWDKEVRTLTEGKGVDQVVEVGGAGTLPLSIRSSARNGQISLIGILTGVSEPVDIVPVLMNNLRIQGIYVGSVTMLQDVTQAFAAKGLHPVIDQIFPFEKAKDAFKAMHTGAHFGKIVLRMS